MNTTPNLAVSASTAFGVVTVLAAGILVTVALLWAVRLGIGVRRREPRPPRPEEQPALPESGPVRATREMRAPNEMPRTGGARLTPHELHPTGGTPAADQQPGGRDPGSGDAAGPGGGA
ncbi:DUF6479 family protein [Streptomyces sp. NPDC006186]|jgi:hypothetical protein|uniref:DUF6479 family protein n=1 Tax=Streptomyces sp. NPDC006186 TaxID=3155248 RepID=UPI0033B53BF3